MQRHTETTFESTTPSRAQTCRLQPPPPAASLAAPPAALKHNPSGPILIHAWCRCWEFFTVYKRNISDIVLNKCLHCSNTPKRNAAAGLLCSSSSILISYIVR
ncbi:hypothetical protein ATANTOWER_007595 [Ataeniobius toweri]|uniref:Uncharacterized protein n=1 Tax=Ataeniobius toweri TaxID=208326 RepID=A0ABU7ANA8_9TELE|nr:hypothetical protein [Ataeniobius toweri]